MKKRLLPACFLLLLACLPTASKATSVLASSFGYNITDATAAFQAAIHSPFDTIIVDSVGSGLGVWTVGPCTFNDLQNRTIIFQPGVKLSAKAGAFPNTNDCLFRLVRGLNISIWGYGATFKMQKAEYNTGQWRHTLALANSTNVDIHGLLLKDSGGDGIFITGAAWAGSQLYCDEVFIEDCVSDNHRRQGMSVTSAQNLTVDNCIFKNTIGTNPEAGLDLEPDIPEQRMVNVLFSNCTFTGNNGGGIRLVFFWLNASSLPVSVEFENCLVSNNHAPTNTTDKAEIFGTAYPTNFVTGQVTFNNCTIENSQWSAVNIRKPAASFLLTFNYCDFTDVSQIAQTDNNPVFVEVPSYVNPTDWFGGLALNNVCIDFPTNLAWFKAKGWTTSPGLGNVSANVGVLNPYQLPPVFQNVPAQQNVVINWTNSCSLLPIEWLEPLAARPLSKGIKLTWATASENQNAGFEMERSPDGTAFSFEKTGEIEAAGNSQTARSYQFMDENPLVGSNYYRLRQLDFDGKTSLSNVVSIEWQPSGELAISPNPAAEELHFLMAKEEISRAEIFAADGRVVQKLEGSDLKKISLAGLPGGIYWLKTVGQNGQIGQRRFLKP